MCPLNCFFPVYYFISTAVFCSATVSETWITPYKCDLMTIPFLPYFIANAANQRSGNDVLTCAQCNVWFVKKKKKNTPTGIFLKTADLHMRQKGIPFFFLKKTILKLELFRYCPQYTAWFNCCANQNHWQLKNKISKCARKWSRKLEKQI